nr:hypothetical protein [Candidatus Freyarchaeota archaeon]
MDKIDAQYEDVNVNALLDFCIIYLQIEEKMYGSVYSRMAKKYTMQFVAKKLGEEPPEGSDEWEWPQVKEYLEKRLERYPYIFNALLYAGGKTEASLQGATGTSRIMAAKVAKQLDVSQPGKVLNFAQAWKQSMGNWVSFRVLPPEMSYSIEDENTIKFVIKNCPFKDSCKAYIEENITHFGGGHICGIGRGLSSDIGQKIITGCDYILDEFANPNCTVRIVKIL